MPSLFRRLFGRSQDAAVSAAPAAPPSGLIRAGDTAFDMLAGATWSESLPYPDWDAARAWIESLPDDLRARTWTDCERAWLHSLAAALGTDYRVLESPTSFVVTAQPARQGEAALAFVDNSLRRVRRTLEELAGTADAGKEILLVFPDHDDYERYLIHHIPDLHETIVSAGMFLHTACSHFVVHGDELARMEPTIVHEMTHSALSHLPIPAWLNEGMAVNSEQRLTGQGADHYAVMELQAKHRGFWTPVNIQDFWNGTAYLRPDEGSELAYDLGRVLVNGMCQDWPAFKRFVEAAKAADAGDAAARELLHLDLGEYVRHFLEAGPGDWAPLPATWEQAPERGAFAPPRRA